MDAYEQPILYLQLGSNLGKVFIAILEVYMNSNWINDARSKSSTTKILKGWLAPNKELCMVT